MKRAVKVLIDKLHGDIGALPDSRESRKCLDGMKDLREALNYPTSERPGAHTRPRKP